jgi:hypothetical protein
MTLEGVLAAIAEERKTTEIAREACKQHPEFGKDGLAEWMEGRQAACINILSRAETLS